LSEVFCAFNGLGRTDEAAALRAQYGLDGVPRLEARLSRADGASNERNHDEERPKGGDLGDVAKGVSGDIVHLGLLDLGKFTLCSLIVRVNSTERGAPSETGRLVNVTE
jgi:hypothetical protein